MSNMPPVERYVRREVTLASGAVCAVALEHRPATDPPARELLDQLRTWCDLAAVETDLARFANRWSAYAIVHFPDRYWFAEVWTTDDEAGYYQIIQRPPWPSGGFAVTTTQ